MDGGSQGITGGDDDRVNLDEFKKAASALKATPFAAFKDIDGREEDLFNEINTEGERILFKELCHYAEKVEKDANTNLGKLLALGEDANRKKGARKGLQRQKTKKAAYTGASVRF